MSRAYSDTDDYSEQDVNVRGSNNNCNFIHILMLSYYT